MISLATLFFGRKITFSVPFYRSLGLPVKAHSISTWDDFEYRYHQPGKEDEDMDWDQMTRLDKWREKNTTTFSRYITDPIINWGLREMSGWMIVPSVFLTALVLFVFPLLCMWLVLLAVVGFIDWSLQSVHMSLFGWVLAEMISLVQIRNYKRLSIREKWREKIEIEMTNY